MRMNIVYATTHGWNIGDDFIRIGCERVVESVFPNHNHIIYDKSPHVRDLSGNVYERNGEFHGNSIQVVKHNYYKIDLMVVAGTPENKGGRMMKFFDLNRNCPVIALALGQKIGSPSTKFAESFRRCGIVTVRSENLLNEYRRLIGSGVQFLPCTSLFWSDAERQVKGVHKVALGWKCKVGKGLKYNDMPTADYNKMVKLYGELVSENRSIDFFIVCHHADEIGDAMSSFPNLEVRYHYDEHEYKNLYWDADFVITPKVHGCGCCASMGIAGAFLPTDSRAGTVNGFLSASSWDKEEIYLAVENAVETSRRLHGHKEGSFNRYRELLLEWKERNEQD